MTETLQHTDILELTTEIVSAHVSNNTVAREEIGSLIQQVYGTLSALGQGGGALPAERPSPAVPVKKSVQPDYIVCLERWNLPSDYPMVAPNYAKQRSKLAKNIGLGTKGRAAGGKKTTKAKKAA